MPRRWHAGSEGRKTGFVQRLLLTGLATTGCVAPTDDGSGDDLAVEESALVSAASIPGTFDYGTWTGDYGTRKLAGAGVLTATATAAYASTGTFTCSGTTSCPAPTGTWVYGWDGTRLRWVDFYDANGTFKATWSLTEDSRSRTLLNHTLGVTRNGWQSTSFGELFLKR